MRRYDPDDTATLRQEVRDAAGVLTSASVELHLTTPAGTPIAPTVTSTAGTGLYDASVPSLDNGVYRGAWTISGAVNDVVPVSFYVADEDDELPPLVSAERFGRKLGYTPTGAELERAYDVLNAASELIRDVAGKTWFDEDAGTLDVVPRRIRVICVESAFRAFNNPEALSQRSIGDSSKSFDRAGREGGEAVYLTTAEEKDVKALAGTSSLVSVSLVGLAGYGAVDPWVAVTAE